MRKYLIGLFVLMLGVNNVSAQSYNQMLWGRNPATTPNGVFTNLNNIWYQWGSINATTGAIDNITSPSTAPFAVSGGLMTAEVNPLRYWCYKGDGASHTLSSVTSCGTTDTTGWTLAQWQAALPAATSLSDQIDWAAIQSYVNTKAAGQIYVLFPAGTAYINKSIQFCGNSHLEGQGRGGNTIIRQMTASTDVIRSCQDGQTSPGTASLTVNDFNIECANASGCGTAVNASFAIATGQSRLVSERMQVTQPSSGTTGNFLRGFYINQFANTRIIDTYVINSVAGTPLSGSSCYYLDATSTTRGANSEFQMEQSTCFRMETGLYIRAANNCPVEGIRLDNNDFVGVIDHIIYQNDSTNAQILNEFTINNHEGAIVRGLFRQILTNANDSITGFSMTQGWHILAPPSTTTGSFGPTAYGFFDGRGIENAAIRDNRFYGAGGTAQTITSISGTASPYTITFTPGTGISTYANGALVTVAGVTPSSLNGTYTVTSSSSGSITATTTATGTYASGGTVTNNVQVTDFMYFGANAASVLIEGNTFSATIQAQNPQNSWINLDAGADDIVERSNFFSGSYVPNMVYSPGYATNVTQGSESYIDVASGGLCWLEVKPRSLALGLTVGRARRITCSESTVLTLDATGKATVNYPAGMLTQTPFKTEVTNGSANTCDAAFLVNSATGTISPTSFQVVTSPAGSCANTQVRVTYTVTGY